MYKNLCAQDLLLTGKVPVGEGLRLARATGYEGLEIDLAETGEIARLSHEKSIDWLKGLFSQAEVIPACWHLGEAWRGEDASYQELLQSLPRLANLSRQMGCERVYTFLHSWSDARDYQENLQWHVDRLGAIAGILGDAGCRLGLEWMGPKTLRAGHKYEFIHDQAGMWELCQAMGEDNVGLLLDSWHWYTSYGAVEDIRKLGADQVVNIHLCDAPAGIPVDEQLDTVREVPGETGVIDVVGFLRALKEIGYDGPVTPVSIGAKSLEGGMTVEQAARKCSRALDELFQAAGIG